MKCAVCEQVMLTGEQALAEGLDHHLQRSPIYQDLCLGCWMAFIEVEKFLIRAGVDRTLWTLQVYSVMRKLIQFVKDAPPIPHE